MDSLRYNARWNKACIHTISSLFLQKWKQTTDNVAVTHNWQTIFIVCVQVLSISGSVLETLFKQWDSQGNVQCSSQFQSSRPVYIVQTTGGDADSQRHTMAFMSCTLSLCDSPPLSNISLFPVYLSSSCLIADAGFLGLLSGLPEELEQLFPDATQQDSQGSAGAA